MPQTSKRIRDKFLVRQPDGSFDDGIHRCEQIVAANGGAVEEGIIWMPASAPSEIEELNDAITYLIEEWDYDLEVGSRP